ncbi:hypothetical protein [Modicisalibacter xianhensis]|uniref:hypothetical protein n=1 Tax=Modicisalibacter xianhensis TaxID=442341 RepID=UPI0011609262|nr:hypothetical protein [Halomonas xianhensis]
MLIRQLQWDLCSVSYKTSHPHPTIPDTPYFSFRSETHFILNSLHLLKKGGYLCAILPETLFTGVRNEWFTSLIKKKHTIEKIIFCEEKFLKTEAKVCIAYIKNSLPSKHKKTEIKNISINSVGYINHQEISPKVITDAMWNSATSMVRNTILGDIAIITRGRLSAKKLHEVGNPFYHSTGLVGSISQYSKVQSSKNKILICRVGKRSAGKIVETSPYEIPTSDCIFSLDFNDKRSMDIFIRAWSSKKADQWKSIFTKGVCSRYLTLEDIKNFPIA